MPKISLWNPVQREDYTYIDEISRQHFDMGATGILVHKYLGPELAEDDPRESTETTIGDLLLLENRNRRYDSDIYELRGSYDPTDSDLDLSQFGIFLSEDSIRVVFHLNDMVKRLGRKLMSGDVLELPHLRDYFGIEEDSPATNRFYVVEDASSPASGFSPRWWNHMWRVRARVITDSPEFENIMNRVVNDDGTTSAGPADDCCDTTLLDILSQNARDQEVSDGVIGEAQRDVEYDPMWYRNQHFYVFIDQDGLAGLQEWKGGDTLPPNALPLRGVGNQFPQDIQIGEYFLRNDFVPPRLFQKQTDCKFMKIETDLTRVPWTGANRIHDDFHRDRGQFEADDGTMVDSRQALSRVLRPRSRTNVSETVGRVTGLKARGSSDGVELTWKHRGTAQTYTVWRSTSPVDLINNGVEVGTSSDRSFTDTTAVSGITYHYRVSVTDGVRVLYSDAVEVEA